MSPEPSSSPDLAAIDLSLSFAPAWAKEADSAQRLTRLAEKHGGGEDRPDRGGKGRGMWDDRGPRRDNRPPRGDGGPRKSGPKRDGGKFDRRPEREPRPAPAPQLTGWDVRFLPDRHGVDGLAKQIRNSAKAYPLFDLARLVLEKSERYLVEFRRKDESAATLFQLKADGTLWLSESDALAHAVKTQIDKFYRRERVTVEPPKGAFPFIAVCGMSGALLGPPNYHDYQSKIRALHAERFANMPFEAFKNRIRMERGEELIAKWREEQSTRDVFYPIDPNAEPALEETAAESVTDESAAPASAETPEPPAAEEATAITEATEPAAPAVDVAPSEPEAAPVAEESAPVVAAEETESSAPATPKSEALPAEKLDSLADVERHFREHHAAKAVVRIRDRVIAPGSAALNESAGPVLELARGLWEELDRFPLPLAHNLGQQLTGKGLQIFKHDNITFVSVARPRYLDVTATPVSEGLSGILAYLEAHASTPRAEQLKALVAARATESDPEAAVARDISWLLHEGHVIDYIKRGLAVAPRPKVSKPKAAPVAKATPPSPAPAKPVSAEPVVENPVVEAPTETPAPEITEPVIAENAAPENASEPIAESPIAEADPEEEPSEAAPAEIAQELPDPEKPAPSA